MNVLFVRRLYCTVIELCRETVIGQCLVPVYQCCRYVYCVPGMTLDIDKSIRYRLKVVTSSVYFSMLTYAYSMLQSPS